MSSPKRGGFNFGKFIHNEYYKRNRLGLPPCTTIHSHRLSPLDIFIYKMAAISDPFKSSQLCFSWALPFSYVPHSPLMSVLDSI